MSFSNSPLKSFTYVQFRHSLDHGDGRAPESYRKGAGKRGLDRAFWVDIKFISESVAGIVFGDCVNHEFL